MPPVEQRIETFKTLSDRLGPGRVIWRYDPILVSSLTPVAYHLERFERLAGLLGGCSERVVVSFMDFYWKVATRLRRMGDREGIRFEDLTGIHRREELLDMAEKMASIGSGFGFDVTSCAEPVDLTDAGILPGACIDAALVRRLSDEAGQVSGHVLGAGGARGAGGVGAVAGAGGAAEADWADRAGGNGGAVPDGLCANLPGEVGRATGSAKKDKGQRKECLCVESVDIGRYNTCLHGCVYCYAR